MNTDLAGGQDVVHVLQEGLILDLIVCEEEGDALTLLTRCAVQELEVFQQVAHVVRPVNSMRQVWKVQDDSITLTL